MAGLIAWRGGSAVGETGISTRSRHGIAAGKSLSKRKAWWRQYQKW